MKQYVFGLFTTNLKAYSSHIPKVVEIGIMAIPYYKTQKWSHNLEDSFFDYFQLMWFFKWLRLGYSRSTG